MKVGELIGLLEEFDPDMPVHISYNYGDYWRTMVAPEIMQVEKDLVRHSGYHNMPAIASDEETHDYDGSDPEDEPPPPDDRIEVVILK